MQREDHRRRMGSIANKLLVVGCAVLSLLAVVVVLDVDLAVLAISDGGESAAGSGGGGSGVLDKPPTIACDAVDPFDYTYGGTQPATMKLYSWKLEDGQGRLYDYASEQSLDYASTENRDLEAMDMKPATKRLGAMVFEVTPDAEDFTLIVNDLIRPQTSKKAEVYL
jgi:hypothetical protein